MPGSQKVKFCLLLPPIQIAFVEEKKKGFARKKKIHDEEF